MLSFRQPSAVAEDVLSKEIKVTNEGEFFGFGASLRSWTHPINRNYPWLKYFIAVASIGAFGALMRITGDWSWVVVITWLMVGIFWFQVFSRWRDLWWSRKRSFSRVKDLFMSLAVIGLILFGSFIWPVWMAFGEDMFD